MSLAVTYAGLTRNARGALWMLASAVTFSVMTMLIKYLGDEYPPTLQTFYRLTFGLLVMLPIVIGNPRAVFRTTRPPWSAQDRPRALRVMNSDDNTARRRHRFAARCPRRW